MAGLGTRFDPTQHDTEGRDFTPLPDGDYRLEVEASDVKPTKAGNGTILQVTYRVIEPLEYENRKIFSGINIENANATAQKIGQEELASLCRACGIAGPIEDSEELHLISFMAKVGLDKPRTPKPGEPVYPQRNRITRFYYPDEADLPAAKAAPAAPTAANNNRPAANDNRPAVAAPAATGKRPWKTAA